LTVELDSAIAFAKSVLPDVVVTSTNGGTHAPGSYHKKPGTPSASGNIGRGVDFDVAHAADRVTKLMKLATAFARVEPTPNEFFYTPLGYSVKRPRDDWSVAAARVAPIDAANHYSHMHIGLGLGWKVTAAPAQPQPPTKEQAMAIAIDPICSATWHDGHGGWIFGAKGHVYSFGGAGYFGGWDDATRARGIPCVAGVPSKSGNGYWLVSAIGETFGYGDAAHPGNYQAAWGAFPIIGAYRDDAKGKLVLVRDDGKNLNLYALPA
jgi:hypothetical protein